MKVFTSLLKMSQINRQRTIKQISSKRAAQLICEYHYSGVCPTLTNAFALYIEDILEGVCCFGKGANHNIMDSIQNEGWNFLELVRLGLKHNEKNDASYLIGKTLKSLPKNTLVVSYADRYWKHSGKIYQATNWIYTGVGGLGTQYLLDGKLIHKKSIRIRAGTNKNECLKRLWKDRIQKGESLGKHRYFYCIGISKRETRRMKKWVSENYGNEPYPKEISCNYDIEKIKKRDREKQKLKPMF